MAEESDIRSESNAEGLLQEEAVQICGVASTELRRQRIIFRIIEGKLNLGAVTNLTADAHRKMVPRRITAPNDPDTL